MRPNRRPYLAVSPAPADRFNPAFKLWRCASQLAPAHPIFEA
jgi:hypothetical protein